MKYLFSAWKNIVLKIENSMRAILFFDYDGTLTPIVSRPESAKIPLSVKRLLKKLGNNKKFIVAVISGRSLKNIKRMVGIKDLIYAGNHGMEIQGKGIRFAGSLKVKSFRPIIREIYLGLSQQLRGIKGVIIEDKGVTLTVHYRSVCPTEKSVVKSLFFKTVKLFISSGKIKITRGKEVLEVRPEFDWHKGKAVALILKKYKNALPIYIGDDITDMDGFSAAAVKDKGISIFVGMPVKGIKADYFLKNTKEAEKFIRKLTSF